ncbi:hypothetical protein NB311A_01919 [Nitrobacter sp. Nb-311A]|uniref:AAA family ATPase n=1 Tax=Nitrobacter sp. Nb-311A TaxID=314253 RepID=UPI0000687FBC|nr:AAA family ATPase [Nitrobacter sp. Nb-311A]EAQ36222.1 hypothetical protein NB311A_01919 [Nitrobacter sp. Nb-311A]
MKISALRLFNVKRFAGRGVAIEGIEGGVNVLCAANEFGKSTSFEALHALFFQPHSSGSGDVRILRPYSGGSPLVEADIVTGAGRFRITKQYFAGRSAQVTDLATGRLVAQADEAENFIAGLVKGGTAGPAGLLWVRQGVTGIERRSKSEEEDEREVRRTLLESVQGEVEAVTGGRRMTEILSATQQALSELVTATGRPKAGGRYASAIEDRDRLIGDEQKLSGEVTVLREALDQRASATKRLAELDSAGDRQERRKAVEAAQAAFDAAKSQSEKLKAAEAEFKLALDRRDVAEKELLTFRAAMEKARELRQKRLAAEDRHRKAEDKRREVNEAIAKATTDVEAAEAREKEARDLLTRLDAALRAREAFERLAQLKDQLASAEATRQALEQGEAELSLLKLPSSAIDELQDLDVEIARLHAVEEAARPSISVDYQPDAFGPVTMDGNPLSDGKERTYDGQARLSIPGIGTMTLRSNRPSRSDDRLEKAQARRRTLLSSMGVDDLAAARKRQVQAQRMDAGLGELRGRLSQLAPQGLPRLRENVAAQSAVDAGALELKADPAQVRTSLAEAEERLTAVRLVRREMESLHGNASDAFIAAEKESAALNAEWTQVDSILGPEEERAAREQQLVKVRDDRERSRADAEVHAERLRATAIALDSAEAVLKRARSVEEAAEKEINRLRETIAGLNAGICARADEAVEEKWRETTDALSTATARVAAFAKEVTILQRLASALEAARSQARELYLKPVMTELTPLLGLLFDDVSITFDEKSLLPHAIRRSGQEEDVDRLSGGMREQLSVLTRLAFARLLARDGRPAPVILDDALVYSDDDRIEKMFDALHRQSRDQQIIVFSCRQRAFQRLGGNILQMTDWQP